MKIHKKIFLLLTGVSLILSGSGFPGALRAVRAQEDPEASYVSTAASFASDILAGDYERVKTEYSYSLMMKPLVASGQLQQAIQPSVEASGTLVEQKPGFISARQGEYVSVDIPCAFQLQSWNLTISFSSAGEISGLHVSTYREGPAAAPEGVTETELILDIGEGRQLPGTLTMPEGAEHCPGVVFVHGSGASDRDETLGYLKPFQDLAWELAQRGIASYRYDKVTYVYGDEIAEDKDFTVYDETVKDTVQAAALLRSQSGVSSVYVLGHSQGAMMMGSIARESGPEGCIMMAAPARSFADTLKRQIEYLKSRNPEPTGEERQVYDYYEEQLALMEDLDALAEDDTVLGQSLTYIRSLLDYDAMAEAEGMELPVLLLQGEEDYQVTMEDFQLWKDQFETKDNWRFQSFPGLTHMFTEGSYQDGPSAYNGEKHVPDQVADAIADFILSI